MIARELGIAVIELPYTEWLQALQIACSQSNDEQFEVLLSSLPVESPFHEGPIIHQDKTAAALWLANIAPPANVFALLKRYVSELWARE